MTPRRDKGKRKCHSRNSGCDSDRTKVGCTSRSSADSSSAVDLGSLA